MLTCRRRRRRRRRHRLQGDATPRTLVGVSEAQKKGQVKRLSARQRGNPQKIRRLVFSSLLSGISEIFPINHPSPSARQNCTRSCYRLKFMYFVLYHRDHFRCIILRYIRTYYYYNIISEAYTYPYNIIL